MKKLLLITLLNPMIALGADLPFPDAVQDGLTLYLSGQTGSTTPEGKPVPGGINPQTKQTMLNIQNILASHHLSLANLKKCIVILSNIEDWTAMNEAYKSFFPTQKYPARTTFGGGHFADGVLVEIDCIAGMTT